MANLVFENDSLGSDRRRDDGRPRSKAAPDNLTQWVDLLSSSTRPVLCASTAWVFVGGGVGGCS